MWVLIAAITAGSLSDDFSGKKITSRRIENASTKRIRKTIRKASRQITKKSEFSITYKVTLQ